MLHLDELVVAPRVVELGEGEVVHGCLFVEREV